MAKRILIKPVLTEKSTRLSDKRNTYAFVVGRDVNKLEIKKAVEDMFNVAVERVNTAIMPGKPKARNTRTTVVRGRKAPFKKAYVTLAPGETIDLFGEGQ
jgi:large subunit ribosomal protein L23